MPGRASGRRRIAGPGSIPSGREVGGIAMKASSIFRLGPRGPAWARRKFTADGQGKRYARRAVRRPIRGLFLRGLERIAVLAVEHRPTGGGDFLAQGVGGGEIAGPLRGPALFGERGDRGGDVGFFRGGVKES